MSTTPTSTPTAAATVHPSCPPGWACDTPGGEGLTAVGWFAVVAVAVLVLAACTGKKSRP